MLLTSVNISARFASRVSLNFSMKGDSCMRSLTYLLFAATVLSVSNTACASPTTLEEVQAAEGGVIALRNSLLNYHDTIVAPKRAEIEQRIATDHAYVMAIWVTTSSPAAMIALDAIETIDSLYAMHVADWITWAEVGAESEATSGYNWWVHGQSFLEYQSEWQFALNAFHNAHGDYGDALNAYTNFMYYAADLSSGLDSVESWIQSQW